MILIAGRRSSSLRRTRKLATVLAGATLVVGLAVACGSTERSIRAAAEEPVALAVGPGEVIRYGERVSGVVREFGTGEIVATIDVASDGQRGLLSLAIDDQDRTFAAWTRASDLALVVAQISPGPERLVWTGPESVGGANGGRLVFDRDGSLLVTVGSLRSASAITDPDRLNGKLMRLDPSGPSDQEPELLSGGWHNPFALAVTEAGDVWVADNDPSTDLERLGLGVAPAGGGGDGGTADSDPLTQSDPPRLVRLPEKTAPSAMAALPDGRLAICSYLREEIQLYSVPPAGPPTAAGVIDAPCKLAVATLDAETLVYATDTGIDIVTVSKP